MSKRDAPGRYLDVNAAPETVEAYWEVIQLELGARARTRQHVQVGVALAAAAILLGSALWLRAPSQPEGGSPSTGNGTALPERQSQPADEPLSIQAVAPQAVHANRPKLLPYHQLPQEFFELRGQGRYQDAFAIAEQLAGQRASLAPGDLLSVAEVARLAGHPGFSADTYRTLLKRHRGDTRARSAALELGRLLMNELRDPSAAVRAFDDALLIAPNDEEAEALRVRALGRSRDLSSCREARDRFLRRHPYSLRGARVEQSCR